MWVMEGTAMLQTESEGASCLREHWEAKHLHLHTKGYRALSSSC